MSSQSYKWSIAAAACAWLRVDRVLSSLGAFAERYGLYTNSQAYVQVPVYLWTDPDCNITVIPRPPCIVAAYPLHDHVVSWCQYSAPQTFPEKEWADFLLLC